MSDASSAAPPAPNARAILEAVRYLNQCHGDGRSFAVLTAADRALWQQALASFRSELPHSTRIARVPAPTDSSHVFLETVLVLLGFDPFESTADDLLRLLTVVLRESAGQETGTVIVLEDAQSFGPRVFEAIRELARCLRQQKPRPLIVLAGDSGLSRVLDSQGMFSVRELTGQRYDFNATVPTPPEEARQPAVPGPIRFPTLTISINNDPVREIPFDRERLLIGRGPHSDICIAGRFISRQHALLVRSADGDWLIDLKSTNGTTVNSRLIRQHRLEDGDVISIGNVRLHYSRPAAATSSPTRDDAPAAGHDPFGETVVMRSLQAILDSAPREPAPRKRQESTAA
ncbi:MAG: FHA domain-containing protein [Gammaproteobacteria bacterium]|nr:FHA domain-containing protein [Gammaproteobacteria bacterium]